MPTSLPMAHTVEELAELAALLRQHVTEPLKATIDALQSHISQSLDHLFRQDHRREGEYFAVRERLSRIEGKLDVHEQDLETIKRNSA